MNSANNWSVKWHNRFPANRANPCAAIMNMCATVPAICSCFLNPLSDNALSKSLTNAPKWTGPNVVRELVDVYYPQAQTITLVMDNLNTHILGSLYEAFAPDEAKRIADRLDIHHNP